MLDCCWTGVVSIGVECMLRCEPELMDCWLFVGRIGMLCGAKDGSNMLPESCLRLWEGGTSESMDSLLSVAWVKNSAMFGTAWLMSGDRKGARLAVASGSLIPHWFARRLITSRQHEA